MTFHRTFALTAITAMLVGLPLAADWPAAEKLDLDAIYKINESRVGSQTIEIWHAQNGQIRRVFTI